ncbi:hypothetical protein FXO21_26855 [Dyadobacter sp. UC 10]|nr:hypothetical protein FXO21_26855 [Dyadobacter sp. UC 10]
MIDQMVKQSEANEISSLQRFEINLSTVGLTVREKEIVRLIGVGRTYRLIADALYISERIESRHIQKEFAYKNHMNGIRNSG